MTQIVAEQIETPKRFTYGDKMFTLWPTCVQPDVTGIMESISVVTKALLERVDAELFDTDLLLAYDAFHLGIWKNAIAARTRGGEREQTLKVLQVAVALGLTPTEQDDLVYEFPRAVRALLTAEAATPPPSRPIDNRARWDAFLRTPAHAADYPQTRRLGAKYLASNPCSGGVERGLGAVKNLSDKHDGPLGSEMMGVLLEAYLDGPKEESELFKRATQGAHLEFTEESRAQQRLWISQHGRRFGACTRTKQAADRPKKHKLGTMAAVRASRAHATAQLVRQADADSAGDVVFGGPGVITHRVGSLQDHPCWNERLEKYAALTAAKVKAKQVLSKRQRENGRALPPIHLLKGGGFPAPTSGAAPAQPALSMPRCPTVLLALAEPQDFQRQGVRCIYTTTEADVANIDLVIIDSVEAFEAATTRAWCKAMIAMVLLGKPALCKSAWGAGQPWSSSAIIRHKPAVLMTSVTVEWAARFKEKHPKIVTCFARALEAVPKTRWRVAPPTAAKTRKQHVLLDSHTALMEFLRRQRRLEQPRGLAGSYVKRV